MAQATTLKFGKFIVELDIDGTGTYTAPCGFTTRGLTLTKDTNDVQIPDCDDPDAPAWLGRDAVSLSASISGEGVLAEESIATWLAAFDSTNAVAAKVTATFASSTVTWTGNFHLTSFEVSAEQGSRATASVSMDSDGAVTQVTA